MLVTLAIVAAALAGFLLGGWLGWRQHAQGAERELARMTQLREEAEARFKVLAADILEATTRRFAEQSQTNLGTLLDPLRTRLGEFQQRVEQVYMDEAEKRLSLKLQVDQLVQLNQALSTDARNLTDALRGSNKAQGNWGEAILERLLETAGLVRDVHFRVQDAQVNAAGQRVQPDVVLLLPEERRLVVDSKVSLLAFEEACNAESDDARDAAIRRHVQSLRTHVRGLSAREYETIYDVSLDFVVLFVPVEPAFLMAVSNDATLAQEAWDRNVLLVSPSTLLFVLRTVAFLWRQEQQQRNTKEIVDRATKMYEKLAGFVEDLETVGTRLEAARESYAAAFSKLSTGNGNVLRQARQLEELGIRKPKRLPKALAAAAADERDDSAGHDGAIPDAPRLPDPSPGDPS